MVCAGFRHRGQIGHLGIALLARHRERAQPAGLNEGLNVAHVVDEHLHLPGQQIGDRWRRAAIRHMHDLDAGALPEELAEQVRGRAEARPFEWAAMMLSAGVFLSSLRFERAGMWQSTLVGVVARFVQNRTLTKPRDASDHPLSVRFQESPPLSSNEQIALACFDKGW